MSNGNPVLPPEAGPSRTLRDRLVDIFRNSSQSSDPAFPQNVSYGNGTHPSNLGYSQEPDARTRLLESYHRREPICGSTSCNHGTFSPRSEGHENSPWQSGYYGTTGYSAESSTRPGSADRSENTSSLENLISKQPMRSRTSLYAVHHIVPSYISRLTAIGIYRTMSPSSLGFPSTVGPSCGETSWPL